MHDDSRDERHFDLEADRRHRRLFTMIVVGFALLAVLGGVILALWWISPPDEGRPPPMPVKPPPEAPMQGFDPFDRPPEPEPEPTPAVRVRKTALDDRDISRGLGRIQKLLDKCAVKHGAIDGTNVTVDFGVTGAGRVDEAYSRSPHGKTPLGLCVANVIRTAGRFKQSPDGRRDIRRTLRLRRPDM